MTDMEVYVDVKEAARLMNVSESRVYRYIETGQLAAYRSAHILLLKEETVKQFKARQRALADEKSPAQTRGSEADLF